MDLPQELIDEIIDNIPPNDRKSLRSCSLVAKSWVYPSRRRIFRSVDISGAACLGSWLDKIPPTNIEILQHVHSLTYRIANTPGSPHPSIDFLRDYSPSLVAGGLVVQPMLNSEAGEILSPRLWW